MKEVCVVYRAEDIKLKRTVALKFLPPELTRNEEAKLRFIHEAQAASALDHPNIRDIGETDGGQLFVVMACYEGEPLKEKIACRPMKLEEAVDLAIQVASGLSKADEKGIVHRNIKILSPPPYRVSKDLQHMKRTGFSVAMVISGSMKSTTTSFVTTGSSNVSFDTSSKIVSNHVCVEIGALGSAPI